MRRIVGLQQMTVCASPTYPARHGRPESIEDRSTYQAITYARDGQIGTWQFPSGDGGLLEVTPLSCLRFDDLEPIADAAEAGHGLAWLPSWLSDVWVCTRTDILKVDRFIV